ncbi:MAG: type II secretion system protein GspL [Cocleimonas sp.]
MQIIVIKISDLAKNPEYALLGKKQHQDRYTSGDWKRVRSVSRGRKVVVLLASNEVVLTSATIPSKNRKQLLQAIPYALEDTLAEDIEDLHFAVHQESESKQSEVAIINRTVLVDVLDLLKSKNITANYVLPELLAQRFETDSWSITYENNDNEISASVRLGQYEGFVCDQEMLDMFISEPLEKQTPKTIFSNTKPENLPEALQEISSSYIESNTIDYKSTISALPLNLLTNFVRRSQQTSSINWKAWRPVALLGGVLASIWMGIFFWQNNLLQNQSNQLKTQIEQVYKESFPNGRIVDASAQMNSALNKLKASAGQTIESPLPLIADMGPLLKEYKDMILSELRYQENQLSMTIESPNLTRLEKFKKDAAEKNNLKIEITDSTTTANKVKAVIRVSPLPNKTANKLDIDKTMEGKA